MPGSWAQGGEGVSDARTIELTPREIELLLEALRCINSDAENHEEYGGFGPDIPEYMALRRRLYEAALNKAKGS